MIWKWRGRTGPSSAMAVLLPAGGGDEPSPDQVRELMASGCASLADHAERAGAGGDLDGSTASLAVLDRLIDGWDAGTASRLGVAVGAYLGTVLVGAGAQWRVGPAGRPYVTLRSGRDVDVMALADRRVATGHPRLADLVTG